MVGIHIILLVGGAALVTCIDNNPPHYVQSKEYFDHAKYYVQNNLPLRTPDIRTESGRRTSAFGILTGVLIDLVKAADNSSQYEPLQVLSTSVPASWRHYIAIANQAQNIVSELDIKTKAITDYMSNTCGTESILDCNKKVLQRVKSSPNIYGDSASLLLLLGPVSQIVVENKARVDELTKSREEIPYLLHNVETDGMKCFVDQLLAAYRQSKKMQYRRFFTL